MRNWSDAIKWLNTHQTSALLGYNPDGRCLEIAREARGIASKYPSARVASEHVDQVDRVHNISDIRAGMVLFFDDPSDNNPFGHIVTSIGRIKGSDRSQLSSILTVTNSVHSGLLSVVAADYYPKHWGDPFVFASKTLNDVKLDWAGSWADNKPPPKTPALEEFGEDGPRYHVGILDAAANKGNATAKLTRDKIGALVNSLPNDEGTTRVSEFKAEFKARRVLRMGLLSGAVSIGGRHGSVEEVFNELKQLIHDLPSH